VSACIANEITPKVESEEFVRDSDSSSDDATHPLQATSTLRRAENYETAISGDHASPAQPQPPPPQGSPSTATAAADNNIAVASAACGAAMITIDPAAVPFEQVQLAVSKMAAAGCCSIHQWLVCIFNVVSVYEAVHAAECLHVADVSVAVAHWIKSFSRMPTIVRWPNACGGTPVLRRALAVRLRAYGVQRDTAYAADSPGGSDSIDSLSLCDCVNEAGTVQVLVTPSPCVVEAATMPTLRQLPRRTPLL
jgi:hypothetical protein